MDNVRVEQRLPCPVSKAEGMIAECNKGLQMGFLASKSGVATHGVYFMMGGDRKKVAVFKPENEEENYDNNPKPPGYLAAREVAAFLLDFPEDGKEEGFGGVPPTTLVACKRFKRNGDEMWVRGSLQSFVQSRPWYNGIPSKEVGKTFRLSHFQRMSVLDFCYGNGGRHYLNILKSNDGKCVPIDHGACFPSMGGDHLYKFGWMDWDHAREPYLPEIAAYVVSLSFEKAFRTLKDAEIELSDAEWFAYQVRQMMLKIAVRNGHVPLDIARFLIGPGNAPHGRMVGSLKSLDEIYEACRDNVGPESSLLCEMGKLIGPVLDEVKRTRLCDGGNDDDGAMG